MNKSGQLEFTDCLGCGKRVATTAKVCHHCKTERNPISSQRATTPKLAIVKTEDLDDDSEGSESHGALEMGGYDDYGMEEVEPSTKQKLGLWWYVAWVLIFFFVATILWPYIR